MFEKCIPCSRIGESCVPNLMLLPFPVLMQWCGKRQKYLGWTNQTLAEKSGVPISTISRIKADDYLDCKYSTIRSLLIALIGGTTDEWLCNEQVDKEIQAARSTELEAENAALKEQVAAMVERYRKDCKTIHDEYCAQIAFLEEDIKAWRSLHCSNK